MACSYQLAPFGRPFAAKYDRRGKRALIGAENAPLDE